MADDWVTCTPEQEFELITYSQQADTTRKSAEETLAVRHRRLLADYPTTPPDATEWTLENCGGMAKYAEIAINGGYGDPARFAQTPTPLSKPADPGPAPPPPTLTSINPITTEFAPDAPSIVLVATGTGFTEASTIIFNDIQQPTTFVSDTELQTLVNVSVVTAPATVPVLVRNIDGGDSTALTFDFTAPP
jgi:hypothetical protein